MKLVPYIAALLFGFHGIASYAQKGVNTTLKMQMDSILADDQRYRGFITLQPGTERDSIAQALSIPPDNVNDYFGKLQHDLDSIDLVKVTVIFKKYGYPGKSIVGIPTNEAAYYVIQHSEKIRQYFPLIEKAGKKGELPFELVAMMQDRLLKSEGKEQIYGTQYAGYAAKDSVTQQQKIYWFLWPVKDYVHVNQRRKKAGFKDTVAEDAAEQGITFEVVTLAAAKKKYPGFFTKQSATPAQ